MYNDRREQNRAVAVAITPRIPQLLWAVLCVLETQVGSVLCEEVGVGWDLRLSIV